VAIGLGGAGCLGGGSAAPPIPHCTPSAAPAPADATARPVAVAYL